MKKLLCFLAVTVLLTGCGQIEQSSNNITSTEMENPISVEPVTSDDNNWYNMSDEELYNYIMDMSDNELDEFYYSLTEEDKDTLTERIDSINSKTDIICCYDTEERYESLEELYNSDFSKRLAEEGYPIFRIEYDEERYEFYNLFSESDFYELRLRDTEMDKLITLSVVCNTDIKTFEELTDRFFTEGSEIATVENFDILVQKTPYTEKESYSVLYLPKEGYRVSIHAENSTKEEIIDYFDDFDFVSLE